MQEDEPRSVQLTHQLVHFGERVFALGGGCRYQGRPLRVPGRAGQAVFVRSVCRGHRAGWLSDFLSGEVCRYFAGAGALNLGPLHPHRLVSKRWIAGQRFARRRRWAAGWRQTTTRSSSPARARCCRWRSSATPPASSCRISQSGPVYRSTLASRCECWGSPVFTSTHTHAHAFPSTVISQTGLSIAQQIPAPPACRWPAPALL